jgi:peptidoglycan/xylan/chitin deacetylase (PgdA/CDA1 family)
MFKMKRFGILILVLKVFVLSAQSKRICITVDDLPVVSYGIKSKDLDREITDKLTQTFSKHKIPAMGYVVESQLYDGDFLDSSKVKLLQTWLDRGCDLGNHTFSHFDYNKVADTVFFKDILQGQKVLVSLWQQYGKIQRYFRHPYLHVGADVEKSNQLHKFLVQQGYVEAPVTIDNDDYLFAKAYHNEFVQKNKAGMRKIGRSYLKYMERKLQFFEQKSQDLFGRPITQTLLIHASLINANYIEDLVKMIEKRGYTFVSQQEVFADLAYASPITNYTKRGISWIFRWGLSQGKTEDFMKGDIEVPKYIAELARK